MASNKVSLILGARGQDGTLLGELLAHQSYDVVRSSRQGGEGYIPLNVTELDSVLSVLSEVRPNVVFNLAAMSSVGKSWQEPVTTGAINGLGVVNVLEGCHRLSQTGHDVKFIQASSSEIFAESTDDVLNEDTPVKPRNPYGAAKAYAHFMTQVYRSNGLFASNAILFNHESPIRDLRFVTRKITESVARIHLGLSSELVLGNLDVHRDWGWAPDYVRALQMISEANDPSDYVVATGTSHSLEEFVSSAFATVGITEWRDYVRSDESLLRVGDVAKTVGDASKIRNELGWTPSKTFNEMVQEMVNHDIDLLKSSR